MRILKDPEVRRAELISAAQELFEKNGIEATSVNSIVRKIGVAQGLFYYYFHSKQDIINAVINKVLSEIDRNAAAIIGNSNKTFYQKLLEYIDLYFVYLDSFGKSIFDELSLPSNNKLRENIFENAKKLNSKYTTLLIDQGIAQKIITIKYPHEMLNMVLGGISTILHERFIPKNMLLTLLEQGLHLTPGSI